MRLPLFLCVAAISVLTGCKPGNCTSDRCTISSMMGDGDGTASTLYKQASASTLYQAAASTFYQSPVLGNQRDRVTPTASKGFVTPGMVQGGCESPTAGGEYDPNTNLIHLCDVQSSAYRRYIIAHETGHAVDYQQDRKFATDPEYWADQYAVNRLLKAGDCDAIAAYASQSISPPSPYTPGIHYAQETLDHC